MLNRIEEINDADGYFKGYKYTIDNESFFVQFSDDYKSILSDKKNIDKAIIQFHMNYRPKIGLHPVELFAIIQKQNIYCQPLNGDFGVNINTLVNQIQQIQPMKGKDFAISPICIPQDRQSFHWVTGIININTNPRTLYIIDSDHKITDILDKNLKLLQDKGIKIEHLVNSADKTLQGNSKACGYFTIETMRILQSYNNINEIKNDCQNENLQNIVISSITQLFKKYGHNFEDLKTKTRYDNQHKNDIFPHYQGLDRKIEQHKFIYSTFPLLKPFKHCSIDDNIIGTKSKQPLFNINNVKPKSHEI